MHQMLVRVYYEDTDAGGVVYHANYLKFFERARSELLRELGFEQDVLLEQNIAFVVKKAELDFRSPARFNQQISINTHISSLKRASLEFTQEALDENQKVLVSAVIKIASVDLVRLKPVAIPSVIIEEFKRAC
ncbi:tol-pal system-associated acyl-CoA thioesterase [Alginatibacterium sediminis]|uniref:Tol-pal system-associated acyl-CoA thioesterase n=1 Tax=Alginatibacterium sediminis TaxID=2164068 RepID=A0A420EG51_9ALTE|nr:tol-pal system-associated acyl-CoA thioesterase [Alginatibacterium sediminis]RKF19685.1 tol-pal system-associated acyl-CoA thioesterase [Alginatibacterium sediminis]